jgi:methylase of polypeptide subunit release factors
MVNALALTHLGQLLLELQYRFVTITPASHARVNARTGCEWARSLRDVFGWSRPFQDGIVPGEIIQAMTEADVIRVKNGAHYSTVRFSTLDQGMFVHSSYPTIAKDAVFLGPDTYKFADAIQQFLEPGRAVRRAADIFAGAGPGAIVIAKRYGGAEVLAIDINAAALGFCAVNAALAGTPNVQAVSSNLLADVPGLFDLIVAHPPYLVDRGGRAYRHGGGPLGAELSLSAVRSATERLEPGGTLLLFTGVAIVDGCDSFREQVEAILDRKLFEVTYREVDPDVFGEELEHPPYDHVDRIALIVLTVQRR